MIFHLVTDTIAFHAYNLYNAYKSCALAADLRYRNKNTVVTVIVRQITEAKLIVMPKESGISANIHQYTLR